MAPSKKKDKIVIRKPVIVQNDATEDINQDSASKIYGRSRTTMTTRPKSKLRLKSKTVESSNSGKLNSDEDVNANNYKESKPKVFKCRSCNKSFSFNSHLRNHQRAVTVHCTECGVDTRSICQFRQHWASSHGDKSINCSRCSKDVQDLKNHKKKGKLMKCAYCSKILASECNFNLHIGKIHKDKDIPLPVNGNLRNKEQTMKMISCGKIIRNGITTGVNVKKETDNFDSVSQINTSQVNSLNTNAPKKVKAIGKKGHVSSYSVGSACGPPFPALYLVEPNANGSTNHVVSDEALEQFASPKVRATRSVLTINKDPHVDNDPIAEDMEIDIKNELVANEKDLSSITALSDNDTDPCVDLKQPTVDQHKTEPTTKTVVLYKNCHHICVSCNQQSQCTSSITNNNNPDDHVFKKPDSRLTQKLKYQEDKVSQILKYPVKNVPLKFGEFSSTSGGGDGPSSDSGSILGL